MAAALPMRIASGARADTSGLADLQHPACVLTLLRELAEHGERADGGRFSSS
jgi:hypothetical protein